MTTKHLIWLLIVLSSFASKAQVIYPPNQFTDITVEHYVKNEPSKFSSFEHSGPSNSGIEVLKKLKGYSFSLRTCHDNKRARIEMNGEQFKVGEVVLGKSTYAALRLTIQL
jgi:hypothetical protein